MKELLKKYLPALKFVAKFIAIYIVLNLLYGVFVESYRPKPDPVTWVATMHTSSLLNVLGYKTDYYISSAKPNVIINDAEHGSVLSVYEGCNGLNVAIIFVAFLFAFRWNNKLLWFVPLGLFIIHLSNLVRIALLYLVSTEMPDYLYFSHKYLFTAFIFFVVFLLWFWWLKRLQSNPSPTHET